MAFNLSISFGQAEKAVTHGSSASVSSSDGWFVRMLGGGKTKAGVVVTEYTALNQPAVYACVNRIANPIARFPLKIFKKSGNENASEVTDHPLSIGLGLRPNEFMSSRTLRKTVQGHALLWGNGYIEIERNQKGQAVGLWPLMPWATKPERKEQRLIYRTTIAGEQFSIDHGDVLHIMDLSQDGYIGHSQIALARQALGMAAAMEEFGAKFFANDAKSGGFLMHPGKLGPQAFTNLRGAPADAKKDSESGADPSNPASRLEKQGGLDNAHRVKVLEEGMKYISTTIPPEDAQFLGSRDFQIAEIARMYDVPLILLQSHEKSTSWGTGIEQLMIGFVRQTIDPWIAAWEQELNWKLFTEEERKAGLFVKFNMNSLLRGDMAARAQFYREMLAMAGLTPNLICGLEDLDGMGPAGDTRFVSANLQTLDRAIASAPAEADETTEPPAPDPTPAPDEDDVEDDAADDEREAA